MTPRPRVGLQGQQYAEQSSAVTTGIAVTCRTLPRIGNPYVVPVGIVVVEREAGAAAVQSEKPDDRIGSASVIPGLQALTVKAASYWASARTSS
jgi:hypothetical protein